MKKVQIDPATQRRPTSRKQNRSARIKEQLTQQVEVQVIPAKADMEGYERPKPRVCAYCRVSTDMDTQALSYELQVQNYTEYITSKRIKKSCPKIKIIVTTSYTDPQALKDAKAAGADSFWFKDFSPIELLEVMDRTVDGRCYWPEEAPDVELGDTTISALTETEKEVLHNLVECISLKKTAEKMFVEESTVKTHLKSIYQKVGCANKTELLVLAMQAKLVLPKKQEN